jgi:thymidine kinase
MNAGKSTLLLHAAPNYHELGMETYLLTDSTDDRAGAGHI